MTIQEIKISTQQLKPEIVYINSLIFFYKFVPRMFGREQKVQNGYPPPSFSPNHFFLVKGFQLHFKSCKPLQFYVEPVVMGLATSQLPPPLVGPLPITTSRHFDLLQGVGAGAEEEGCPLVKLFYHQNSQFSSLGLWSMSYFSRSLRLFSFLLCCPLVFLATKSCRLSSQIPKHVLFFLLKRTHPKNHCSCTAFHSIGSMLLWSNGTITNWHPQYLLLRGQEL